MSSSYGPSCTVDGPIKRVCFPRRSPAPENIAHLALKCHWPPCNGRLFHGEIDMLSFVLTLYVTGSEDDRRCIRRGLIGGGVVGVIVSAAIFVWAYQLAQKAAG